MIIVKEASAKVQYEKEFNKFYKKKVYMQNNVIKDTSKKMKGFRDRVVMSIQTAGSDSARWNYQRLLDEFDRASIEFFDKYSNSLHDGIYNAGYLGMDKIINPMKFIGIKIPSVVGLVNDFIEAEVLMSMRYVDTLNGNVKELLKQELQMTIAGGQTSFEMQQKIARDYLNPKYVIVTKNGVPFVRTLGVNWRAEMITRTEMSRVYQAIGHKGAVEVDKEFKDTFLKKWVTSGTGSVDMGGRTRETHWDEEQRTSSGIPIKESFLPGGFSCQHPLDPALPASETINCMCDSMVIPIEW